MTELVPEGVEPQVEQQVSTSEPSTASEKNTNTSTTNPLPDHSRRKNPPPPGMSLSAYKRELRKKRFELEKEEWAKKKKEKRKALKLKKKAEGANEPVVPRKPLKQENSGLSVIIDCGFDEMMKEGEVKSLGQQLIRCYSENKKASKTVNLSLSSFNKTLLHRFETNMKSQHTQWKGISISQTEFVPPTDEAELQNWVYLSSDSLNTIEALEPAKTYIIGGIVDKGRYKDLCKTKAEKLNISTGRLPIDEFVKISGRRVLTTNHVFEILLKWLEVKDWKLAFETVLPPRKLMEKKPEQDDKEDKESEDDNEEDDENSKETEGDAETVEHSV